MIPINPLYSKTFAKKNLQGKICLEPFMGIAIDPDGNINMCSCGAWMPTIMGNIKANTIQEILSSPTAYRIRESIRSGTYEFCDESKCGMIINNKLLSLDQIDQTDAFGKMPSTYEQVTNPDVVGAPRYIYIAGDRICNLSCPSCRDKVITEDDEEKTGHNEIIDLLNTQVFGGKDYRPITLYLSSTGELFASPRLLKFIENFPLARYPRVELNIQSNGLLLKDRWHRIKRLEKNIFNLAITADSHLPETYEKLRRGGRLTDLVENLKFVQELRKTLKFKFSIRMVVQEANALEIEQFCHWAFQFGADTVELMRLLHWQVFTAASFKQNDALAPEHPLYNAAISQIKATKSIYGDRVVLYHFDLPT